MNSELIRILFGETVFALSLIAILDWFISHKRKNNSLSHKKVKYLHWIFLAAISITIMLITKSRIVMVSDEYYDLFSYRTIYRFFTLKENEIFLRKSTGWPLFLTNISLIIGFLGYKQVFLVNGVLYVFSVILFYELIKKIAKSRIFALLFATIYATNYSIIFWAITSENHTLSNFYLILGFIFLFDFFEKPSTKNITATLWTFAFSALIRPENFFVLCIISIVLIIKILFYKTHFKKRRTLITRLIAIFVLTSPEFLGVFSLYNGMHLFNYYEKRFSFTLPFFLKEILHLNNPVSLFITIIFGASIIFLLIKKEKRAIPLMLIFFTFLIIFRKADFEFFDLYRFNHPLVLPMYITIALAARHILNKKGDWATLFRIIFFIIVIFSILKVPEVRNEQPYTETTIRYIDCITSIKFTGDITKDYLVIIPEKYQYYFLTNRVIDYSEFRYLYRHLALPRQLLIIVDNNSWHISYLNEIISEGMPLIKELEERGIIEPTNSVRAKEGCNLNFYKST